MTLAEFDEVLDRLKITPDYSSEWAINDMNNLIKDGLLDYDKEGGTLTLLLKAKRPSVPLPQDSRRNKR